MEFDVKTLDLLDFTEGAITATFEKDGKTYTATGQVIEDLEWTYELQTLNDEQTIYSDGTAVDSYTFIATAKDKEGREEDIPVPGVTINFTTTSGTCTPSAVTEKQLLGVVDADVNFKTDDVLNFEGATITGTCEYKGNTYDHGAASGLDLQAHLQELGTDHRRGRQGHAPVPAEGHYGGR